MIETAADRASFFADFGEVDVDGLPAMRWTSGVVTTRVAGHLHRGSVTIDADEGARVLNNRGTFHCALEALPIGAAAGQSAHYECAAHTGDYTVKSIEPDGTGMIAVLLEEDA